MEPFKALSLIAAAAVVSLVGAGALGFYAGYSAGRSDLEEIKSHISSAPAVVTLPQGADGQQVVSLNMKPVLAELRTLSAAVASLAGRPETRTADAPDYGEDLDAIQSGLRTLAGRIEAQDPQALPKLAAEVGKLAAAFDRGQPQNEQLLAELRNLAASVQQAEPKAPRALLEEIKALSATLTAAQAAVQKPIIDELRYLGDQIQALQGGGGPAVASSERGKSDGGAAPSDIAQLRQLLAAAAEQFGRCQTTLATFTTAALQPGQPAAAAAPRTEPTNVVLYDNVILKRDEEKLYSELGLRLTLQGISARQVRLAVNRQGFGLAFGERKVFRHQDVECELNLAETNLNDGEARVSISCKR